MMRRTCSWFVWLTCWCALSGCANIRLHLDRPAAPFVWASDSATFSVKPVDWIDPGRISSEFLMEIAVVNTRGHAALLSPDSLVASFRPDPFGKRPCVEVVTPPVDFWARHERLVEAARMEHDTANPHHPDPFVPLFYGLAHSSKFDRKLSEYSRDKWNEAQWDKKHGGYVNMLDTALLGWRNQALLDTVLQARWEARRLFAIPATVDEGTLILRLRFGGVTDSVVFRQRLSGMSKRTTWMSCYRP